MGKGDRKSRKGKIFRGSHGVVRPKKSEVKVIIPVKKKVEPEKELAEKPVAVKKKAKVKKKVVLKKTAVKKK